jgi:hypothetical protein
MLVYIVLQCSLIPSYLIIPFCGWRIYVFLKRNSKQSIKMRDMYRQISRTMTIQAICPLICVGAPFCIMYLYLMINLNNPEARQKDLVYQIAYDSSAIVPIVNALAAIFMINAYRQSILNICLNVQEQVFKTTKVTIIPPATSNNKLFTM